MIVHHTFFKPYGHSQTKNENTIGSISRVCVMMPNNKPPLAQCNVFAGNIGAFVRKGGIIRSGLTFLAKSSHCTIYVFCSL